MAPCDECGTGVFSPTRDAAESKLEFDGTFKGLRLARRSTWIRQATLRANWLQLYVPDGTVLELGCATGEFLSAATRAGYTAFGVDPSAWAGCHARRLGVEVTTGVLDDWRAEHPGYRVDAVVMWHVLEHVADPIALLRGVEDVLKPDGYLVMELSNFGFTGENNDSTMPEPQKLDDRCFRYTPDGARRLLATAGFIPIEVLEFSTRIYDSPGRWAQRHHAALRDRSPWPPIDALRLVARKEDSRRTS